MEDYTECAWKFWKRYQLKYPSNDNQSLWMPLEHLISVAFISNRAKCTEKPEGCYLKELDDVIGNTRYGIKIYRKM